MHVETFAVGPLGCNCSIVAEDVGTRRAGEPTGAPAVRARAIVVDPGGDYAEIQRRLDALGAEVVAIVHTHAHVDHVGSTAELQDATGAVASIHEKDRFLYLALPVQAVLIGTPLPRRADMDDKLVDGAAIRAGSLELGVLHTPGHTPGSCCFVASDGQHTRLFAGDTLFRDSIGRTDLWGGDQGTLLRSIRHKVLSLPDDVPVVAGHGPSTTIGRERAHNPFLRGR